MLNHLNPDDYVLIYKNKPLLRKILHRFAYTINYKDINQTLRYAKVEEGKKAEAIAKMF